MFACGSSHAVVQIFFFAGMALNEFVNLAVKNIVREPRPPRGATIRRAPSPMLCAEGSDVVYGKYGFPSNHTQAAAFWCLYGALFVVFRHESGGNDCTSQ